VLSRLTPLILQAAFRNDGILDLYRIIKGWPRQIRTTAVDADADADVGADVDTVCECVHFTTFPV